MRTILPLIAALLLAGGCMADHHHHPAGYESTDEAFDNYFRDRTNEGAMSSGTSQDANPGRQ